MLNRFSREIARRYLLSIRATALGVALVAPQMSHADTDRLIVQALTFDGASIVVASDAGLWRIDRDRGTRFPGPGTILSLTSHPDRPATLFATLDTSGLSRSLDGGATWIDAGAGLPPAPVLSVAMAAAAPDTLYAAVAGDGIWRSEDAGESWAFVMDRPYLDGTEQDVLSLVSVGSPTGMGGIWLYAGTDVGLTRVPDCFCRWHDVTAGDAMDALVAGETPTSTAPLPPGAPVRNLGVANAAPSQIYAGLKTGLWASTNAGVDWSLVSPTPVTALAVDPDDPLHLMAARTDRLDETCDGGKTWSPLTFTQDN